MTPSAPQSTRQRVTLFPLRPETQKRTARGLLWVITAALATNQLMIGSFLPKPAGHASLFSSFLGTSRAAAKEILSTKLKPDGKTTTIAAWPTITEVPAEPRGMSTVDAAKVVMVPTGTPFYAPKGVTFDEGVKSLDAWQPYEKQTQLSDALQKRYDKIIGTMTCDYCCGSADRVTIINNCGCKHAGAFRSITKLLLKDYADQYSDEQIIGELQRWKGVWYPKGVVEDYLLATGRGDAIGHQTHGGAGSDGRHGIAR